MFRIRIAGHRQARPVERLTPPGSYLYAPLGIEAIGALAVDHHTFGRKQSMQ